MLFIDRKGNTLVLAEERTIKVTTVDKDTFYYDEGFVTIIADNDFVKLAETKN